MKKSITTTLLATGFCLSLGLGVGLFGGNADVAMAETPVISTVAGAAVRLPDRTEENDGTTYENYGIRFSSVIDKSRFDELSRTYTVTTGTFILPWTAYDANAINEENCFAADTAKYYWQTGTAADGSPVYNTSETAGKTLIYHSASAPVPDGENYRLNGSAVNLGDADMTGVRFVGVGYVKCEADGTASYLFGSTDETNARSVAEVAQKLYYKADGMTADKQALTNEQKSDLANAYVQKYINLYKAANGENPTVDYTLKVNMETSTGFESFETTATAELDSYDATLPGTQTPAMIDGSAKASRFVYNTNTTSDSLSVSEDEFMAMGYYGDGAAIGKSSDWSVDGTSICIDFGKANGWLGFSGAAISMTPYRYVSFVAYCDKNYPIFAGNSFWVNGTASYEAKFELQAGVPSRIVFDLGQNFTSVNTFAFQENAYDPDSKLYIDDVRFYNKTVESIPYNTEAVPVNPISLSEDNILSLGSVYKGATGAVTKSTAWSVDGKSESLCFDFSKRSEDYWMGMSGTGYSWGATTSYISFVAYCEENYETPDNAFWITTIGGGCDVDFSLTGGVAKKIVVPVTGSGVSKFTFQYSTVNKNCKLYIDDIKVYSETTIARVAPLDVTEKAASMQGWAYNAGRGTPLASASSDWSADGKSLSLCIDFSQMTDANNWIGVNLNGYSLGATYKYMSFTAYCEKDYNVTNALWISDVGQNSTIYTSTEFSLKAGKAQTFEWNYNSDKLSIFSLHVPADFNCKIYIDDIRFYNEKEAGPNPGLYTETIVNQDKVTVLAGFTSLITAPDAKVTITISYQTEEGGEWKTLVTESDKLAAAGTIGSSSYCKVKVTATSESGILAEQIVDLSTNVG